MNRRTCLGLLALLAAHPAHAQEPFAKQPFTLDTHRAFIIPAPTPAPGHPWVWYAPTLGQNLPGRDHHGYFATFHQAGISIAGIDLGEVRGSPASTAKFAAFHAEMVKRGYSAKPILLGQSRGGLMMLAFATQHPDKVGAFAGIYPVCNLSSWPLKSSKDLVLADYGLPETELVANLARYNPVDNLQALAARRVPLFSVHGDHDTVVPLEDNTAVLQARYQALGGPITVKVVPGEGHKVGPSFFQCQELTDFVIAQAALLAKPTP